MGCLASKPATDEGGRAAAPSPKTAEKKAPPSAPAPPAPPPPSFAKNAAAAALAEQATPPPAKSGDPAVDLVREAAEVGAPSPPSALSFQTLGEQENCFASRWSPSLFNFFPSGSPPGVCGGGERLPRRLYPSTPPRSALRASAEGARRAWRRPEIK